MSSCEFPPSNADITRIARFRNRSRNHTLVHNRRLSEDQVVRMAKRIEAAAKTALTRELARVLPRLKELEGRVIRNEHLPMTMISIFELFMSDCMELLATHAPDEDFSAIQIRLMKAFAAYRYNYRDVGAKNAFVIAYSQFCQELAEHVPDSDEIRQDFQRWTLLAAESIDSMDVTAREIHNSIGQQKKVCMTETDCRTMIGAVLTTLHASIDRLREEVRSLMTRYHADAESDNCSTPPECWLEVGFDMPAEIARLTAMSPPGCGPIDIFLHMEERCEIISTNGLQSVSKLHELLDTITSSIQSELRQLQTVTDPTEMLRLANRVRADARTLTGNGPQSVNNTDHAHLAFDNCSDCLSRNPTADSMLAPVLRAKGIRVTPEAIQSHPLYDRLVLRIEALKAVDEAHQLLDTFLVLPCTDLIRLIEGLGRTSSTSAPILQIAKAATAALPTSGGGAASANRPVAQKQKQPAPKQKKKAGNKNKGKKAAKRAEKEKEVPPPQPKKTVAAVVEVKPREPAQSASTLPSVPSPAHPITPLVGRIKPAPGSEHRGLWRQHAMTLGTLPLRSGRNLARLTVTVLHGTVEQTLRDQAIAEGATNINTHNAWSYGQMLKPKVTDAVVRAVYNGVHWTRFGRNWTENWNKWSTLSRRPVALAYATVGGAMEHDLQSWQIGAIRLHDSMHKAEVVERPEVRLEIPKSELSTVNIEEALAIAATLPASTWIKQWQDDLADIKETLQALHEPVNHMQFAVLVSHALMLLQGVVQSPLYAAEIEATGTSSTTHQLTSIARNARVALSMDQQAFIAEHLHDVHRIHRYPYLKEIGSSAHRLYLNAIALAADPALAGFSRESTESTTGDSGVPVLKRYLSAIEIRAELTVLVEKTVAILAIPIAIAQNQSTGSSR